MTAKFLVKIFGKKGLGRVEGMQAVFSSLGVMILGGNGQVLVCSRKCLKSSLPPPSFAVLGWDAIPSVWQTLEEGGW